MGKRPNTVRLRYGYNTVRNSAPDITVQYRPKTSRFYTVYCRKGSVFTAFMVRFRVVNGAVLIDLGRLDKCRYEYTHANKAFKTQIAIRKAKVVRFKTLKNEDERFFSCTDEFDCT
jgi:hypothetical protein